ncbi:unnamed protein product [Chilo suppressalis]|uniref:Acetyl-coenzyme A transporter 1 n=1 Tax=Chilo suppressalis TaxID=168631 RepID=A0ABN8AY69_CHISP|nr:unnamed protein product [Chilo suppressalis]
MPITKRKNSPEKEELLENGDTLAEIGSSNIKGDEVNIAVLLFLYTLQGIPLGLAAAVPMLLQNRGITYTQQAEFSLVYWPFSLKLLWAPVVDAFYWPNFGRRKTWLVPVQYLIGLVMIIMSSNVTGWLGSETDTPSMMLLTSSFMFLNFLAATQDIAVDGWALTMLKRCNVGHASTCNTVGQTAGYFLGYVLFLALESPYFCNKYLRSAPEDTGMVTLASFLLFWGWIFIATTTLIAIFKHEANEDTTNNRQNQPKNMKDIVNAYKQLYTIVKLPAVQTLALVLFTAKLGFCASDAVSGLKLVEAGVPREDLALLAVPLVPVQIIMPVILAKHTTGPAPFTLWLKAFPLRLLVGPLVALLVALTPSLLGDSGPSYSYLFILMSLYVFHQTCLYCMFVAVMAFYAKVSDPTVGGTYMTLLNTVSNLGTNWPNTLALWAIDHLTFKRCTAPLNDNTCSSVEETELCKSADGTCEIRMDGFYIETVLCLIVGYLWLQWGRPTINRLQRLPPSAWQIGRNR